MIIHLGDEIGDATALEELVDVPLIKVPGNCDHGSTEPRERLESINGHTFYISHGDLCRVKTGVALIARRAAENKASVALFGHTHQPLVTNVDGIMLINPGTLMAGSDTKSCAILKVTRNMVSAEIRYI